MELFSRYDDDDEDDDDDDGDDDDDDAVMVITFNWKKELGRMAWSATVTIAFCSRSFQLQKGPTLVTSQNHHL